VEALKRRVPVGVGDAGERLGVGERRLLGLGVKLGLPPRAQGVDLGPGDARLARRLVVQVEAVGAVVELRDPQAQQLGEAASIRSSALYPNASAPIRAMPISGSLPLASSRRFATLTSSAISVPFGAHRPHARASRGPAASRSLAIFYRFTVEETIENGDRPCDLERALPRPPSPRRRPTLERRRGADP
jgi:hypothetical protein